MARLLLQSENVPVQAIELRLGVNRLGRSDTNDFPLDHASVSSRHCEIVLSEDGLVVRDCSSTNGTRINGKPIKEAPLLQGQVLHIGGLEFLVENTDVTVEIPQFELGRPTPPIVLEDGTMLCPRHPEVRAIYQCVHCREVLCETCVKHIRRRGGKMLKLCPVCGRALQPLGVEKRKKRSLLEFLQQTVKLPSLRRRGKRRQS